MALLRSCLGLAAFAAAGLLALSPARAAEGEISFCNDFPHTLYIAIAYEQYPDSYISRGWLEVETGKCAVFDTAIRVHGFYFRAESETYREGRHKVKMLWGTDRKFAIRDSNFQSYNADKAYSGMRLAGFAKGVESSGAPVTAVVTFTETGGSTISIPKPQDVSGGGEGGPPASPQAAPPQASSAPQGAPSPSEGGIEDKSSTSSSGTP